MAIKFGRPIEARTRLTPVETEAPAPTASIRRPACAATGRSDWSRRLVRENKLSADDLIWPVFVQDGQNAAHAGRLDARRRPPDRSTGRARGRQRARAKLGIPCIALFPETDPELRDDRRHARPQPGQSRLPRHPRDQEGRAGDRHPLRRGARSLHQPRPRRPAARRRDPQRRDRRGAGQAGDRAGARPAATSSRRPT